MIINAPFLAVATPGNTRVSTVADMLPYATGSTGEAIDAGSGGGVPIGAVLHLAASVAPGCLGLS